MSYVLGTDIICGGESGKMPPFVKVVRLRSATPYKTAVPVAMAFGALGALILRSNRTLGFLVGFAPSYLIACGADGLPLDEGADGGFKLRYPDGLTDMKPDASDNSTACNVTVGDVAICPDGCQIRWLSDRRLYLICPDGHSERLYPRTDNCTVSWSDNKIVKFCEDGTSEVLWPRPGTDGGVPKDSGL